MMTVERALVIYGMYRRLECKSLNSGPNAHCIHKQHSYWHARWLAVPDSVVAAMGGF